MTANDARNLAIKYDNIIDNSESILLMIKNRAEKGYYHHQSSNHILTTKTRESLTNLGFIINPLDKFGFYNISWQKESNA